MLLEARERPRGSRERGEGGKNSSLASPLCLLCVFLGPRGACRWDVSAIFPGCLRRSLRRTACARRLRTTTPPSKRSRTRNARRPATGCMDSSRDRVGLGDPGFGVATCRLSRAAARDKRVVAGSAGQSLKRRLYRDPSHPFDRVTSFVWRAGALAATDARLARELVRCEASRAFQSVQFTYWKSNKWNVERAVLENSRVHGGFARTNLERVFKTRMKNGGSKPTVQIGETAHSRCSQEGKRRRGRATLDMVASYADARLASPNPRPFLPLK